MQKWIHCNDKSYVIYWGTFSLFWLPHNQNKLTKTPLIFSIQTNRVHHLDLISRLFSHGNFPLMSWIVCLSNNRTIGQNHNDCCRHLIIITSKSSNPYFSSYSSECLTNSTTYKHYDDYFGGFRHWAVQTNFGASSGEWLKSSLPWLQLVSSFAEGRTEHVNSHGKLSELIKLTYHEWIVFLWS